MRRSSNAQRLSVAGFDFGVDFTPRVYQGGESAAGAGDVFDAGALDQFGVNFFAGGGLRCGGGAAAFRKDNAELAWQGLRGQVPPIAQLGQFLLAWFLGIVFARLFARTSAQELQKIGNHLGGTVPSVTLVTACRVSKPRYTPRVKRTSKIPSSEVVPLYQLKITLKWSLPPIWRRVVVRADISLERLHWVIQATMPWTNSHLHQFVVGDSYYGRPNLEFADMGTETLDERRFALADVAPSAKSKLIYEYDFGDGWEHEVKVEKVLPPDANFKHPVCLAGKYACPPDDCGGMPG
jgi:hypothetical protein